MLFNRCGDILTDDRYSLPKAMLEWGGGSSSVPAPVPAPVTVDTSDAQRQIAESQEKAIAAIQAMYGQARADVAPWREVGGAALNQVGGILNLPGYTALDPTATLNATPGYQFLKDQGNQALSRYGAATGLSLSGPAAKGALNYGQNLANTYAWQPYMNSLQTLSGQGQNAATQSGNWAMSAGAGEAGTYMTGGTNIANLMSQEDMYNAQQQSQYNQQQWQYNQMKAYMENQQQNSMWNDIMSGVGFAGSLALAPFTGGTSLLGVGSGMGLGALGQYGGSNAAFNVTGSGSGMSFYPLKAEGGPVDSSQPYIIGERGPEVFIPETAGYIIPNHLLPYTAFGDMRKAA